MYIIHRPIIDGVVYINDKQAPIPINSQFNYIVKTNGMPINPKILDKLDITEMGNSGNPDEYIMTLTNEAVSKLKIYSNILSVNKNNAPKSYPK